MGVRKWVLFALLVLLGIWSTESSVSKLNSVKSEEKEEEVYLKTEKFENPSLPKANPTKSGGDSKRYVRTDREGSHHDDLSTSTTKTKPKKRRPFWTVWRLLFQFGVHMFSVACCAVIYYKWYYIPEPKERTITVLPSEFDGSALGDMNGRDEGENAVKKEESIPPSVEKNAAELGL